MLKAAVLVSGGGTNLEAIFRAEESGTIRSCRVGLVVSDRPGCFAIERAKARGVKTVELNRKAKGFHEDLLRTVEDEGCQIVVLAGFLSILRPSFIEAFRDRILNVHPSLIPSFCGDGFYGLKVHEAALSRGVKVTGATVHLVNEITDGGRIVRQKAVEVLDGDSPESLQRRVMEQAEWVILPLAIEDLASSLGKEGA